MGVTWLKITFCNIAQQSNTSTESQNKLQCEMFVTQMVKLLITWNNKIRSLNGPHVRFSYRDYVLLILIVTCPFQMSRLAHTTGVGSALFWTMGYFGIDSHGIPPLFERSIKIIESVQVTTYVLHIVSYRVRQRSIVPRYRCRRLQSRRDRAAETAPGDWWRWQHHLRPPRDCCVSMWARYYWRGTLLRYTSRGWLSLCYMYVYKATFTSDPLCSIQNWIASTSLFFFLSIRSGEWFESEDNSGSKKLGHPCIWTVDAHVPWTSRQMDSVWDLCLSETCLGNVSCLWLPASLIVRCFDFLVMQPEMLSDYTTSTVWKSWQNCKQGPTDWSW